MTGIEAAATRRLALLLEYDGARFSGSQLQANARTVQGELERTVESVTGSLSRIAFAGRTDAGVHARGQVASFLSATRLDAAVLMRALNATLPADVVVRELIEVAPEFDARRHALRRHYRYVIHNAPTRPALQRERAWHVAAGLDVDAMAQAARGLLGRRDFAAFASPLEDRDASTVRELFCFDVASVESRVSFDVVADAFLPHQVRRMAGALVEVGKGRMAPEAYMALLSGVAASAGPVAPPQGLYLIRVEYAAPLFSGMDSELRLC